MLNRSKSQRRKLKQRRSKRSVGGRDCNFRLSGYRRWYISKDLSKSIYFPGGSDSKESSCSVGDLGLIPGLGRSSKEGNGNPLQYSCLENFMDRGVWWATVHEVTTSQTWLSA